MKAAITFLFLAACGVGEYEDDDLETDYADDANNDSEPSADALRGSRYSADGEPSPSRDFNFNGRHNDQCVRLRGVTQLYYADAKPIGYLLDPKRLAFTDNPRKRPEDDSSGRKCRDGEIQLDTQEIIEQNGRRYLFHRGGYPYSPAGDVKYGFVWIGDLANHAAVGKNQANGIECAASKNPATEGTYRIAPRTIPSQMTFRKSDYAECARSVAPADLDVCTNGYTSYGDPGFDQGSVDASGQAWYAPNGKVHYTYLLWNFTNVRGGGVVRAPLPPDQVFHRCNVRSIKQTAYTEDGKRAIGWVKAIYGKTRVGSTWLYGWIVHSHACTSAKHCGETGTKLHVR